MSQSFSQPANFIWSVADRLRGDYGKVIFGVKQRMLAKMVWQQFQQGTGAGR